MDSGYKLKWLNGLLAGRELALPTGEIRLGGSDADVAVTLEDGQQAVLVVDDGGVKLTSQASVWVDGNRWEGDERLPLNLPVDLAGQAFILGAAADTLAHPPVPVRRSPAAGRHRQEARQAGVRSISPRALAACIAAIAALGGVVAVLLLSKRAPDHASSQPEPSLVEQVQKRPPHGVKIAEDPTGVIILSGYCADSVELDRLRQQLQQAGRLVRDDTVCADVLRHSVRAVLTSNGYEDVDISDGAAPGTVLIRGAFAADSKWSATADQLAAIRGLRKWSVANDRAASFERLLRMLKDRDLLDGLSISVVGRTLVATGAPPAERKRAIEDVVAEYDRSGAGMPATFESIAACADAADLLPSPIASVGGNADGLFVELENGMRLRPGAVLPSGCVVYTLSRSFIGLRKAEQLSAVPLGL